ncbi:MAG: hypothetical protein JRJ39_00530 [Deltaproteobacteria bacterium]|nr:hypothetical protein [Deltaproteobacteria bacterium]MBW1845595.1 hypothetical protein [Deltaproteobacteria bacterium]MBW2032023.1 hypothetical protein [Deltaproteobacteria bacterium]
MDLIAKMEDLLKQTETEKSHYYVASTLREAIREILTLRAELIRILLKKV